MPTTSKHGFRIPDQMWEAVIQRADDIAALGVPGEHDKFFSAADIVRTEFRRIQDETIEQTMKRLGLTVPEVRR